MAKLSPCADCGGSVARSTTTCPHCGSKHPHGREFGCASGFAILGLATIVIFFGTFWAMGGSCGDGGVPPPVQPRPSLAPRPAPTSVPGTVEGRWADDYSSSTLTLYRDSGRLRMRQDFRNGSALEHIVSAKRTSRGRELWPAKGSHGDYWVVLSDGRLESRDGDGRISVAKPID